MIHASVVVWVDTLLILCIYYVYICRPYVFYCKINFMASAIRRVSCLPRCKPFFQDMSWCLSSLRTVFCSIHSMRKWSSSFCSICVPLLLCRQANERAVKGRWCYTRSKPLLPTSSTCSRTVARWSQTLPPTTIHRYILPPPVWWLGDSERFNISVRWSGDLERNIFHSYRYILYYI